MNRLASFFGVAVLLITSTTGCVVARTGDPDAPPPGIDAPFVLPDAPRPDTGSVTCDPGLVPCDGVCARLAADDANCGSCGNACPSGTSCAIGRCDCLAPMRACDGVCLDVSSNPTHCGACGNTCAATEVCSLGECVIRCDGAGRGLCTRTDGSGMRTQFCADFNVDNENCGTCGTRCSGGSSCIAGVCACPGGGISCGGTCTDPMTDPLNCGACLSSCGTGGTCSGGVCTACGTGRTLCGTPPRCVDTSTSRLHCGMCGRACGGGEACSGGLCECTGGLTDCGRGCTNLSTDVTNCGACGVDCGAGGTCSTGACTCAAGYTMCGPECANLMRDRDHCGDCTTTCGMGFACQMGSCVLADSFRVLSFATTNCRTVSHATPSGDDRGGIAVSSNTLFYTGDSSTARMSSVDLSGLAAVGVQHNGIFSDLESETVYVLLDAANVQPNGTSTITQLGVLDGMTGLLTATRIPLSMSIPVVYGTAVMAGYAEALLGVPAAGRLQWYRIELPSGQVTMLGTTNAAPHASCENWAWWGIAELFDDVHYATYVENNTRIVRLAIPETGASMATATLVSAFTNLSDMCSITFSTSRNRWYFHHEGSSQFTTAFDENAGFCDATWDRP